MQTHMTLSMLEKIKTIVSTMRPARIEDIVPGNELYVVYCNMERECSPYSFVEYRSHIIKSVDFSRIEENRLMVVYDGNLQSGVVVKINTADEGLFLSLSDVRGGVFLISQAIQETRLIGKKVDFIKKFEEYGFDHDIQKQDSENSNNFLEVTSYLSSQDLSTEIVISSGKEYNDHIKVRYILVDVYYHMPNCDFLSELFVTDESGDKMVLKEPVKIYLPDALFDKVLYVLGITQFVERALSSRS